VEDVAATVVEQSNTSTDRGDAGVVTQSIDRLINSGTFLIVPIILIMLGLWYFTDAFMSTENLLRVARAASIYAIIGVGQTFVITSGNIDLSVGSSVALTGAITGTYLVGGGSVPRAMLLSVAVATFLGAINGLIVAWLGVPALLATLGTLITYRGAVLEYMGSEYHVRFPDAIVYLGQGFVGPIPIPVIIALVVAAIGGLLFRFTKFGRVAVAIGGNETAAILAGINVKLWKLGIYAFQGFLVGIASLVLIGRLNAAHPSTGQLMELHVIAGVVLGGTLLFGGRGFIFGSLLGMFLIGVLENGLLIAGLGFFWQQIVLGILLIFAVGLQMSRIKGGKSLMR
jgi:ribose transport system permease protein